MTRSFDLGFGKTEQELTLDRLPVSGDIPAWLQGTLIRNGPGTFKVGTERYRHWFDGLAMLHKFSFSQGRVSYANKFLEGRAYRAALDSGKISYSEFATDPCRSFFGRVMALFSPKITDSAKVNIAKIADRFMALAETPMQVEFDPGTLETVGVSHYNEPLTGHTTTVHPQVDVARDEVYNLVTRFHRISHYKIYKMAQGASPQVISDLPVKQPAYIHSFGMTQTYLILAEFPLVVNPLNLLLQRRPYIENFRWRPERGTPFWVINRHTGELVGRYESDPFFAFHHVNAFEQGDEIILDIVAYPDSGILDAFYLARLEDERSELPFGNLRRYRLPVNSRRRATYETVSEVCMELPHFDYARFNMQPAHRYVYAVSINPQQRQGFYNQLVKVNVKTGRSQAWFEEGCYPGEPIFVKGPDRTQEDEGVILSVVLDAVRGTSYLLILDARTFIEKGRAEIPQPILFGYHGAYFADL